jgi:hypothetical protein
MLLLKGDMVLMLKRSLILIIFALALPVFVTAMAWAAPARQAVACTEDYTVQGNDWLSAIAQKYYGDVLAYTVIVNATNAAAQTDSRYTPITDPSRIETSQVLCIPSAKDAEAMLNGELVLAEPEPVVPEDKMLIIAGNRSLTNANSVLLISGGQFAEAQQFEIAPGKEVRIELEPGDYKATWIAVGGSDFGRKFTARAGTVVIAWLIPEENLASTELRVGRLMPGLDMKDIAHSQLETPSVTTLETPYSTPPGQALLVVGNRSYADIPSTLTLSGGRFGEGKEVQINPAQEVLFALEPGDYRATWTAPEGKDGLPISRSRAFTAKANRVGVVWFVPEASRAFLQAPGEPGVELTEEGGQDGQN